MTSKSPTTKTVIPRRIGLGLLGAIGILGAVAVGPALADDHKGDTNETAELQAVQSASTSLSDAIAAAQKESGGKATEASAEFDNGVLTYEVEVVMADGTEKELLVKTDGTVSASADDGERGEAGDDDGDDEQNESSEKAG